VLVYIYVFSSLLKHEIVNNMKRYLIVIMRSGKKKGQQQQQQQQQHHPVWSCFREVWKDPSVGSLTLASITIHKEADSKRPIKIKTIL